MNLICEYQSNYNGWSIDPEENGITEQTADDICDALSMITWELCDEDGYCSCRKFPKDVKSTILNTVRTFLPECVDVTITFDDISS